MHGKVLPGKKPGKFPAASQAGMRRRAPKWGKIQLKNFPTYFKGCKESCQ